MQFGNYTVPGTYGLPQPLQGKSGGAIVIVVVMFMFLLLIGGGIALYFILAEDDEKKKGEKCDDTDDCKKGLECSSILGTCIEPVPANTGSGTDSQPAETSNNNNNNSNNNNNNNSSSNNNNNNNSSSNNNNNSSSNNNNSSSNNNNSTVDNHPCPLNSRQAKLNNKAGGPRVCPNKFYFYTSRWDERKPCSERCEDITDEKPNLFEAEGGYLAWGDGRCKCSTVYFPDKFTALKFAMGKVPGAGRKHLWPCKDQAWWEHDRHGPGGGDLEGCIKGWESEVQKSQYNYDPYSSINEVPL